MRYEIFSRVMQIAASPALLNKPFACSQNAAGLSPDLNA
jgi:hypothetical protein